MSNEIQIYEKMRKVTMKDGRTFFYPKTKDQVVQAALKNDSFVTIEGTTVNKFEIKYIEDMNDDYDVLIGLNEDQRNEALKQFAVYKSTLGKEPPREVKIKKVKRILGHEV